MRKILFLSVILFGCTKPKEELMPSVSMATYNLHVESGHATFKCMTTLGWVTSDINGVDNTVTVEMSDELVQYVSQLISDSVNTTDSLHIEGIYKGKHKEMGYRSNVKGSQINVSVQLPL